MLKLSSTPPTPFAPIVTQWFYRGACCWKTRLRKISIKGGVFLCGSQESLASGFHPNHKGVFLPDLYSFTQWVGLPLLFPSKESPDKTFVRAIIGYLHVASSSTSLGVQQPLCPKWIPSIFLKTLFFHITVWARLLISFLLDPMLCQSCQAVPPKTVLSESQTHKLQVWEGSSSKESVMAQSLQAYIRLSRYKIMSPIRWNLFWLICLNQPYQLNGLLTSVLGFFPDCVSGVDPQGGKARFREQQDLLHKPLSSIHQQVLQRASDEGYALRWHPVWQRDGEWNKT